MTGYVFRAQIREPKPGARSPKILELYLDGQKDPIYHMNFDESMLEPAGSVTDFIFQRYIDESDGRFSRVERFEVRKALLLYQVEKISNIFPPKKTFIFKPHSSIPTESGLDFILQETADDRLKETSKR